MAGPSQARASPHHLQRHGCKGKPAPTAAVSSAGKSDAGFLLRLPSQAPACFRAPPQHATPAQVKVHLAAVFLGRFWSAHGFAFKGCSRAILCQFPVQASTHPTIPTDYIDAQYQASKALWGWKMLSTSRMALHGETKGIAWLRQRVLVRNTLSCCRWKPYE